jgi:hypothetical protein
VSARPQKTPRLPSARLAALPSLNHIVSVLVDLAYVSNVDIGTQIRDQLVDVVGRVRAARSYAVKVMVKVLSDDAFLLHAGEQAVVPRCCGQQLGYVQSTAGAS